MMQKHLAFCFVAGAGLLAPTILNAQSPEPGQYSGRSASQEVTSSQGVGVVEQANDANDRAAISQPMRRSVSINSSYLKKFYTNAQMADVGLETMQAYSFYTQLLEAFFPRMRWSASRHEPALCSAIGTYRLRLKSPTTSSATPRALGLTATTTNLAAP